MIISSDPLALLAIEAGLIKPPLADAAAEGASQLDKPQEAAEIGQPVPIVFGRRDEAAGTGGVLISPPATEASFSNDASNAVTASYHLVLSEGRVGQVQVRDVFQRSCRVGTHSQTYNRRAGTWQPGNFITQQGALPMPQCPYYCGTIGTYHGLSTLSFTVTIPAGFDFWNRQVHVFIRNGMAVQRLRDGTIGSSNNFADLYFWALQNSSAPLRLDQIDVASLQNVANFLAVNGLHCDIRITESANLSDLVAKMAPYFLLAETRINGRRGLRPLLPVTPTGAIQTGPLSVALILTEDHILPDGFEIAFIPPADRRPFCVQAIWRQQLEDDFGIIRTSEVRYAGEAEDGPFEQHDLSAFATTELHAVRVATYIRARRRYVSHTARAVCRADAIPPWLSDGDRVRVTLQRDPSATTAGVHDFVYAVDRITRPASGETVQLDLTQFPVDDQGRSLVALDVAAATGTGIMLSSNKTGVGCDINSSTDETVPAEEYIEAEEIDSVAVIRRPDGDGSNSDPDNGYENDSGFTKDKEDPPPPSQIPVVESRNAGVFFPAAPEWKGKYLSIRMQIAPIQRAPAENLGPLVVILKNGLVVEVDANGDPVSPQPTGLPTLDAKGEVAKPWSQYPEGASLAFPPEGRVFEGVFNVPFEASSFPTTPGHQYLMPVQIIETEGGFPEVAILNETVAVFEDPGDYDMFISIIDEDSEYSPTQRNSDWATFAASSRGGKPFILLIPGYNASAVGLPTGWTGDSHLVSRPGDNGISTDYFLLLDSYLGSGAIKSIRIAVDNSGSMDRETVAADLDSFKAKCAAAGIVCDEVDMSQTEAWIAPHLP